MEDPDAFEQRPRHRRVGMYLVALFVAGIAGSILVFALMMQGIGWPLGLLQSSTPVVSPGGDVQPQIRLYLSEHTRRYLSSVGGNYEVLGSAWRRYSQERQNRLSVVSDLKDLKATSGEVLVLPSALALDDSERAALKAYQAQGGRLLMTWATGTRDGAGQWRGWDLLENFGQLKFAGEQPRDDGFRRMGLVGQAPISHRVGAGDMVQLGNTSESVLRLRSPFVAAYALSEQGAPLAAALDEGPVVFAEHEASGSRVVVLGFAETSWEYQPHLIYTLLDGALAWLVSHPSLMVPTWPQGRSSAQVVTLSPTADGPEPSPHLEGWLKLLSRAQARASVYLPSTAITQDQATHLRPHELLWALPAGWATANQPATALAPLKATLSTHATPLPGADAGWATIPSTAHQAVYDSGFRHLLSLADANVPALPYFANLRGEIPGDRLVVLPHRVQPPQQVPTSAQLQLSQRLGGLAVWSLGQGTPADAEALATIWPAWRRSAPQAWFATSTEVSQWWRQREHIKLDTRVRGQRLEFDLTLVGDSPPERVDLILILPRHQRLPQVSALKLNMPQANVSLLDPWRALISFESLPKGNYSYLVTFGN